jgi:hypothetical protein
MNISGKTEMSDEILRVSQVDNKRVPESSVRI